MNGRVSLFMGRWPFFTGYELLWKQVRKSDRVDQPHLQPPSNVHNECLARLPPVLNRVKNGLLNSRHDFQFIYIRAANVYAEKIHFFHFISNCEQMLFH